MRPIRIGQVGIGHAHASAKMETLRALPQYYEVVGYAEEDAPYRRSTDAYDGIERLTEDELLNIPGLEAVAVETNMPSLCEPQCDAWSGGCTCTSTSPAGRRWSHSDGS